jgi:outer membrane lipoprotein carrier protein
VIRFALGICLLARLAPGAEAIDVTAVLRGVEQRYNRARTLQVDFEQTYDAPRRGERSESGELFLRKPGRMRWQYSDPAGKLFISDGKIMWLYLPGSNRAERTKVKESDDMRAPLAFLLGRLDFDRDFRRFLARKDGDNTWITAEPRSERAPFRQVKFQVTPSYVIREVHVVGHDNTIMQYRFEDERLNPPLTESLFNFKPPPGAQVVEAAF